mmetsp:Transcript_20247/g.68911  ORF Transcript_20247/g.68911 Transcript_20247/m.68911 type:complete len:202 (-) Transcript_20247:3-608(-)
MLLGVFYVEEHNRAPPAALLPRPRAVDERAREHGDGASRDLLACRWRRLVARYFTPLKELQAAPVQVHHGAPVVPARLLQACLGGLPVQVAVAVEQRVVLDADRAGVVHAALRRPDALPAQRIPYAWQHHGRDLLLDADQVSTVLPKAPPEVLCLSLLQRHQQNGLERVGSCLTAAPSLRASLHATHLTRCACATLPLVLA